MALTIIEVTTDAQLREFANFPFALYANDPYWVGELKTDTLRLLSAEHVFWHRACRALFLAKEGDKTVGRIMALVNHAHNEYHKENIGFFGFFDCINDKNVSRALFQAAEKWLRGKGVTAMRGPANPSSNHVYGLLVDGFDSMPAIMMPYNYPYYAELIEQNGCAKIKDLLAFYRTKNDAFSERFLRVCARCERAAGVTLRPLNLKNLEKEAQLIREIYNKAWAENWGFVPLSEEEMHDLVQELKPILRPEGTCLVEVEGKPAGFYIAIPNMNHVLKELRGSLKNPLRVIKALWKWHQIKDARLIMLGVAPEFRKRGLDLILIKHIIEHGVAVWDAAELSWVLEDNENMIRGIKECGCRPYKRYRIYQKEL